MLTPGMRTGSVAPVRLVRAVLRPAGYLLFVVALASLSGAARLLGRRDELGFFSGRLAEMLWRYPEITRRGIQWAWLTWGVLFVVAITPLDPISSSWDEAVLAVLALLVLSYRFYAGQRAGR